MLSEDISKYLEKLSMKKYFISLMILGIMLFVFTSCNANATYHTVTIDYDIEWLPQLKIAVKEGDTLTQPINPEKEGWAFVGWKNEDGDNFDFSTRVTSDFTVKALWTLKKSTVTLKDTSGNTIKQVTVNYGSVYTLPTNLGYTIASCVDEDGNSISGSVEVTKTSMVLTITKGTYTEYNIGDIGPGGGYIVYDAKNPGEVANKMTSIETSENLGWRYLEMSAEDLKEKYVFGYYRESESGENKYVNANDDEHKKIGSGKTNTAELIAKMGTEAYLSVTGSDKGVYAALAAALYDGGGYSDWFLPSSNEVFWLMTNLAGDDKYKITTLTDYWTSTEEGGASQACSGTIFNAGGASSGPKDRSEESLVRPFRCF
jgi:uncharacterized repeat protein (TIGR02543 family)